MGGVGETGRRSSNGTFTRSMDFGFQPDELSRARPRGKLAGRSGGPRPSTRCTGITRTDVGRVHAGRPDFVLRVDRVSRTGATDGGGVLRVLQTGPSDWRRSRAPRDGAPMAQSMGITIDGPTADRLQLLGADRARRGADGGEHRGGRCSCRTGSGTGSRSGTIRPANKGRGTNRDHAGRRAGVQARIDAGAAGGREHVRPVRDDERAGAGGSTSRFTLDDLSYTARREAGVAPVRHPQGVTKVSVSRGAGGNTD